VFSPQLICPTGWLREFLSSPFAKNISLYPKQNRMYQSRRPALDPEGRFAVVTNAGCGMRWTCLAQLTNAADTDGEGVWSWSPDAEIKFVDDDRQATVAKKPGHRGELVISRKPLRRECRCFGVPAAFSFACEPRVRLVHPVFPAPSC
jgi:hypothetical protein